MNKVATMLCNNIEEDKNAIETHDLKDNTEADGDDGVVVGNGGESSLVNGTVKELFFFTYIAKHHGCK